MTWEYIAGFFDGEGTAWAGKGKRKEGAFTVSVANTNLTVLRSIRDFLFSNNINCGMYSMVGKERAKQYLKRGWKLGFSLKITSRESTVKFLKELLPFLIVKKSAALNVICFIETKKWRLRVTPELMNEAASLYAAGLSTRQIERQLKISSRAFREHAPKYDIILRPVGFPGRPRRQPLIARRSQPIKSTAMRGLTITSSQ